MRSPGKHLLLHTDGRSPPVLPDIHVLKYRPERIHITWAGFLDRAPSWGKKTHSRGVVFLKKRFIFMTFNHQQHR